MTAIYLLIDPRDQAPRYVGKSVQPKHRYKQHCNVKNRVSWVNRWLGELQSLGLKPTMEVLEWVKPEDWQEAEIRWIAYYKELGAKLCNLTKGGDGVLGHQHNLATRERLREAAKRQWGSMTEEQKQAYRDFSKGRKQTSEEKAKQIAAQTGKTYSDQWRSNISKSLKGRRNTPEQMAKQMEVVNRQWLTGERKVTEAMREQYRTRVRSRKRWVVTDEAKEKIRVSMKARLASLTQEQRKAKIQAALLARGVVTRVSA